MTYRKVLVVDDDEIMRELLTALLGIEGYHVQTAESGEDALAVLASGAALDILLVDLHMPGIHGAELVERLNEAKPRDTLLIAMSGSKLRPEEAGLFGAFLQKPFEVGDFVVAVDSAKKQRMRTGAAEGPASETAAATATAVLNEEIFNRMAAMLPVAQMRELYRITIEDVRRRVGSMRASLQLGEDVAIRAEAHAIKGGCGMVGASELSQLAAYVEADTAQASKEGNPPFGDFDAACARLQVMLDARFRDNVGTA